MYTVIGYPRTRTFRVMWMLEELCETYDLRPVMPQSQDVRTLSPLGKIPILTDGDRILTDSIAICQFLADKHGALTASAGTYARARQDAMTHFIVSELDAVLWAATKHSLLLPEGLRLPDMKRVCIAEFETALDHLATVLDARPYMMGEAFTVPDLIAGHCFEWATLAGFPQPKSGYVADFIARLRARPAFGRATDRMTEVLK